MLGVVFVVLVFVSAAMVSLPTAADSETTISTFYRDHGAIVVVQQLVGALALVPFVVFAISLRPNRWLRPAVLLFIAVELATNVVPLIIVSAPAAARRLTLVEDLADATLFLAAALFVAASTLAEPLWVRLIAYAVAALCIVRAIASPLSVTTLDQVAPLAFVAFVLLLSGRAIVRPTPAAAVETSQ